MSRLLSRLNVALVLLAVLAAELGASLGHVHTSGTCCAPGAGTEQTAHAHACGHAHDHAHGHEHPDRGSAPCDTDKPADAPAGQDDDCAACQFFAQHLASALTFARLDAPRLLGLSVASVSPLAGAAPLPASRSRAPPALA